MAMSIITIPIAIALTAIFIIGLDILLLSGWPLINLWLINKENFNEYSFKFTQK
jgi:uncharacterized membrane protein